MALTIRPGYHIIPTEQGDAQITFMAALLSLHAHGTPAQRPIVQLIFAYRKPGSLDLITVRDSFSITTSAN